MKRKVRYIGLGLLTLLGLFLLTLLISRAYAWPPEWDADDEISSSGIESPASGSVYAVNQTGITFTCGDASDTDHRYAHDETPQHTYPEETSFKYTWSAVWADPPHEEAGEFPGGKIGQTVTYTAPSTAGEVKITVTVDDETTEIPEGEEGTRDDAPLTFSVNIYIIDGLTVIPPEAYIAVNKTKAFYAWTIEGGIAVDVTAQSTFEFNGQEGPFSGDNTLSAPGTPSDSVGAEHVTATYEDQTTDAAHDSDVTIFDVNINTPASFPAYVAVNEELQLGSAVSPSGISDGNFQWTKNSGPGSVTFSPNAATEDPTFKANAVGTYTVKIEYTKEGSTASDTSGNIIVFDVEIDTPASFPAYVAVNQELQLGSTVTPGAAGGGTYKWSKVTGPVDPQFLPNNQIEDPKFKADTAGTYSVKVEYTKTGSTASDTSGNIVVVKVEIGDLKRVPINVDKEVTVTLTPSPIGTSITLELTTTSGSGAGTFDDGNTTKTINQTTIVKVRGTVNSSVKDNIKLAAKLGSTECDSDVFTVSTWPINFSNSLRSSGDHFGLSVNLSWQSESGDINDLGNVRLREYVTYPHPGANPPFTVHGEDPTILPDPPMPGTCGGTGYPDTHDYQPGWVDFSTQATDYMESDQKIQFEDTVYDPNNWTRVLASYTITREVIGDDVPVIPVGNGKPNTTIITAGPNNQLDTTPVPDDTIEGTTITSGPNGVANTTASGDDVPVIPVGQGEPNTTVITAGVDGDLETSPAGDDTIDGNVIKSGADGIANTVPGYEFRTTKVGPGINHSVLETP